MRSKGRGESEVLAGILAYLSTRSDCWFWRMNTGGAKLGDAFVRFGLPGAPDILLAQAPSGRMIGIEVKREVGGSVSPDQERWGKNLTAHGGRYIIARGIDDVRKAMGEPVVLVAKEPRRQRVYPR